MNNYRSANHDYFNTTISANTNDPLYTPEFTEVIRQFCDLTVQPNISLVDLSEFIHKFKKSTILSTLLKRHAVNNVSDQTLTCLKSYLESEAGIRNIPSQFLSHFLSIAGITINIAPSTFSSINSSLAQVTYNNTIPMKMLTKASADAMESQLIQDMHTMRTYTVEQNQSIIPIKFKVEDNILDLIANAQLDYCNTVIEGNRRHNIEVSPYIESKMKD